MDLWPYILLTIGLFLLIAGPAWYHWYNVKGWKKGQK